MLAPAAQNLHLTMAENADCECPWIAALEYGELAPQPPRQTVLMLCVSDSCGDWKRKTLQVAPQLVVDAYRLIELMPAGHAHEAVLLMGAPLL